MGFSNVTSVNYMSIFSWGFFCFFFALVFHNYSISSNDGGGTAAQLIKLATFCEVMVSPICLCVAARIKISLGTHPYNGHVPGAGHYETMFQFHSNDEIRSGKSSLAMDVKKPCFNSTPMMKFDLVRVLWRWTLRNHVSIPLQ